MGGSPNDRDFAEYEDDNLGDEAARECDSVLSPQSSVLLFHPLVGDLRLNFDGDFLDVLLARRAHRVFNFLRD